MAGGTVYSAEYLAETRAPGLVAANVCCQLLSTIFVVARLYTKIGILRSWKPDDTILVFAWLLALASNALVYYLVSLGAGHHIQALPPQNVPLLHEGGYVAQIIFLTVVPAIKLVVCIAYRRVFVLTTRHIMDIILAILVLTFIPSVAAFIFQCKPVSAYWLVTSYQERLEKCIDLTPVFYINAISTILTDVLLIVVAFAQVWKLQMPKRQQIALLCVVSLGWLAVVACIIRVVIVFTTIGQYDASWDAYKSGVWTAVEINVSLICVTAPTLKPLVARWRPHMFSRGSQDGSSAAQTGSRASRFSRFTCPKGFKEMLPDSGDSSSARKLTLEDDVNKTDVEMAVRK